MIEGFFSGYQWTMTDALEKTIPQIIMIGHSGRVNYENSDRRYKAKAARDKLKGDNMQVEDSGRTDELGNSFPKAIRNTGNPNDYISGKLDPIVNVDGVKVRVSQMNSAQMERYWGLA